MITAIVLAAGSSRRMGQPKMLLPWGNGTVLGSVIDTFQNGGVTDILVVTGGAREQVEAIAAGRPGVRTIFNEEYESGEMLSSIQCGLQALLPGTHAALIGLGDQPQVREETVRRVCDAFLEKNSPLVVPSYRQRRGHPWLVAQTLWSSLLALKPNQTPRDFLNIHSDQIEYVNVETPSVIEDLDTPEDYSKFKPDAK